MTTARWQAQPRSQFSQIRSPNFCIRLLRLLRLLRQLRLLRMLRLLRLLRLLRRLRRLRLLRLPRLACTAERWCAARACLLLRLSVSSREPNHGTQALLELTSARDEAAREDAGPI